MDRTRKYVHTSSTIPATTMTAANCHNCWHLKLRPHPGIWDLAHPLFCRGHDLLPVRAPDSDLRLPAFCRAVPESTTGERGATGNRERHRDRTPWQEECAQRGLGPGGAGQARAAPRAGRDLLGDGALPDLAAVAQQGDGQDLLAARRRQMLALLFLLYRGRTRADLRPCPHLVAVPFADLLQRT